MDKRESSHTLNRLTGGNADEMFCHRVYVQSKLWGGSWIALHVLIDLTFYVIRRERQHVRKVYLLERRRHAKTKVQNHQGTTAETQETSHGDETSTHGGKTCARKNPITTTSYGGLGK